MVGDLDRIICDRRAAIDAVSVRTAPALIEKKPRGLGGCRLEPRGNLNDAP
jgi:hypothetical protein